MAQHDGAEAKFPRIKLGMQQLPGEEAESAGRKGKKGGNGAGSEEGRRGSQGRAALGQGCFGAENAGKNEGKTWN